MNWTREHDALIARVAEGRSVEKMDFWGHENFGYECQPEEADSQLKDGRWCAAVDTYNTDIVACLRAAAALCLQAPKDRGRSFTTRYRTSPGIEKATAIYEEYGDHGRVHERVTWQGRTICEAAAKAIYTVCEGNL